MRRPRDWLQFGAGVLWLIIAMLQLFDPIGVGTSVLGRYTWLVWLLGSAAFFIGAYRKRSPPPVKHKPIEKPETE